MKQLMLKIPKVEKADLPLILGLALIFLLALLAGFYLSPFREHEVSIENALYLKWTGFSMAVLAICILPKDLRGVRVAFLAIMIGCILNALALVANDGYMPASALIYVEGHHIPMNESARLPFLCDWIFGSMSIGDLFLFSALPVFGYILGRSLRK